MKELLITLVENYNLTLEHFTDARCTTMNPDGSRIVDRYFEHTAGIVTEAPRAFSSDINSNIVVQLNIMKAKGFMTELDIQRLHNTIISEYFTGGYLNTFPSQEIVAFTAPTIDTSILFNNGTSNIIQAFYIQLKAPQVGSWNDLIEQARIYIDNDNNNNPCFLVVAMQTRLAVFQYIPEGHGVSNFEHKVYTANGLLGVYGNEATHVVEFVPQTNFWFTDAKVYDISKDDDLICIHGILYDMGVKKYPDFIDPNLNKISLQEVKSHDHGKKGYRDDVGAREKYQKVFHTTIRTPMSMRHEDLIRRLADANRP